MGGWFCSTRGCQESFHQKFWNQTGSETCRNDLCTRVAIWSAGPSLRQDFMLRRVSPAARLCQQVTVSWHLNQLSGSNGSLVMLCCNISWCVQETMSALVQRGAVLYSLSQEEHSHRKLQRREQGIRVKLPETQRSKQDVRNYDFKVNVPFLRKPTEQIK